MDHGVPCVTKAKRCSVRSMIVRYLFVGHNKMSIHDFEDGVAIQTPGQLSSGIERSRGGQDDRPTLKRCGN